MPRLTELYRACAIGQLQGVLTISKLKANGRPNKTPPQEDRFFILSALRNHGSQDLQARALYPDNPHTTNLWSLRAARRPAMTALHGQARLHWNVILMGAGLDLGAVSTDDWYCSWRGANACCRTPSCSGHLTMWHPFALKSLHMLNTCV
uniref:Uncharacterized protein n=1 Tax=Mola mola TaxID=94237 RepID=A0A3Q3X9L8_MOLML